MFQMHSDEVPSYQGTKGRGGREGGLEGGLEGGWFRNSAPRLRTLETRGDAGGQGVSTDGNPSH